MAAPRGSVHRATAAKPTTAGPSGRGRAVAARSQIGPCVSNGRATDGLSGTPDHTGLRHVPLSPTRGPNCRGPISTQRRSGAPTFWSLLLSASRSWTFPYSFRRTRTSLRGKLPLPARPEA